MFEAKSMEGVCSNLIPLIHLPKRLKNRYTNTAKEQIFCFQERDAHEQEKRHPIAQLSLAPAR